MSIFTLAHRILARMAGIKGQKPMGNNQSKRIATAVTEFVNNHINREFTAQELRQFVLGRVNGVAPASSDRIMRQLRKEGKLNYELVSRVHSLYRGLDVAPKDNYEIETGKFRSDNPDKWVNPSPDAKYEETIN